MKHPKLAALLLIAFFLLPACGESENPATTGDNSVKTGETKVAETATESAGENTNGQDESAPALPPPPEFPLNIKAEDLYFNRDDIDLGVAVYRSVSDGENIYFSLGAGDLYIMPVGTDEIRQVSIDVPEGMFIYNMAVDTYGRIHLLVTNSGLAECLIWRLDENYQVDKKMDITAYTETGQGSLIWFMVDKGGNYYLQWAVFRNGIIVDSAGELKHKTTVEALGTDWIAAAGVGKDGQIYLVFHDENRDSEIGRLDVENGAIERLNPAIVFRNDKAFGAMFAGRDANLIVVAPFSGIWACDTEKGISKNRLPAAEFSSYFAEESWPLVYLPDGRLVVLGVAADDEDAYLVKYIPLVVGGE